MSRTSDEQNVEITLHNRAIHVSVNEIETRCRSPVSEESRLHMLDLERLLEQRIRTQIDLADRQIVGRAPVSIEKVKRVAALT